MNNPTINANMGQPVGLAHFNDDEHDALALLVDQVLGAEIPLPAQSRRGCCEAVLAFYPQHQPALLGLGEALLELDQRAPAADAFERALQISPGNLGAIDSLARALGRDQGEGQIMQRLEDLLLKQPDTDARLALAGRMCQTLALLDSEKAPEWRDSVAFSQVLYRVAQRAVEQNDPDSALRVHEFALGAGEFVQRPGAFSIMVNHQVGRAAMLLRLDRLIDAGHEYWSLWEDFPEEVGGPNGLIAVGSKMIERQMHPEAESLLQEVLHDLPLCPDIDRAALNLFELGYGFLALDRPVDAIKAFAMVPGREENPHAFLLLARAISMLGHQSPAVLAFGFASKFFRLRGGWQQAKSSAEEGLAINPDSVGLLSYAGFSSLALRQYPTAHKHWSRCAEITPQNAEVRHALGVALTALGRHEEALNEFERAFALDSQNAEARYGAAWSLIKLANQPRVANEWQTPAQKTDRLRAAIGQLQEGLLVRPGDPSLQRLAAGVQYRLGKPHAALRGYRAVLTHELQEAHKLEALRGKARAEGELGLGADALMTALELPIDDPVLIESVVNAVAWRVRAVEDVAPPESKKRRLT